MLLQFTVENFRSIKERAFLSLIPSASDKEHPNNIAVHEKANALKTVAMYGANASGKSNLFKAITAALLTIRTSNSRQITDKMDLIVPFLFDEKYAHKPSSFEFTFIASDGLKYIYGFSADREKVHDEYLYCYLSAKPTRIFDRTANDQYEFNQTETKALNPLIERNTSNKLFLSTATLWNYEKTIVPYTWLAEQIDTFSDFDPLYGSSVNKYAEDNGDKLKQFTINLLHQADVNIADYSVEVINNSPVVKDPLIDFIMQSNILPPGNFKTVRITTGHNIEDSDHNIRQYQLDLPEESQGTQQLFMLSPILKEVFENGKVMLVDELDKSLHSFLVQYIIDLFQNPSINKNNAQLLFSTHDTNLLSLDTFRRDQIYFVEKNAKTAETSVYSLDEFSVRKSENIERGYLLGRYGAVPFLHSEVDLWD